MPVNYREKLSRLTDGRLTPAEFGHTDHIGVAYEALLQSDFFDAAARVAAGIRTLADQAGVPEKFNATITWAFTSLIAERMHTTGHQDAADFIRRNPDLDRGTALAQWYSPERLSSDLARSVALLPERPARMPGAGRRP